MSQNLTANGQRPADQPLRVVVADDHFVVRQGVRALLEEEPDCEVIGEAGTGREGVEKTLALQPDVAVLDVAMPELNGLEATRQIRRRSSKTQVVVLTMHDTDGLVRDLLRAGALGYVLKTDAARDLVAAVRSVANGRPFFTSTVARRILSAYLELQGRTGGTADPLTPREREVVQLLAEGRSNKEVAGALGISPKTAETHRAHVIQVLNLHSISDLVHYAVRHHIIEA